MMLYCLRYVKEDNGMRLAESVELSQDEVHNTKRWSLLKGGLNIQARCCFCHSGLDKLS